MRYMCFSYSDSIVNPNPGAEMTETPTTNGRAATTPTTNSNASETVGEYF